jgi:hypothetical protein
MNTPICLSLVGITKILRGEKKNFKILKDEKKTHFDSNFPPLYITMMYMGFFGFVWSVLILGLLYVPW